jgi:hypothetical protein
VARYLEILAVNEPAPIGVDANDRVMFTASYNSVAAGVTKYEEEIAKLLFDASLGVLNTDLLIGPKANWPTGNGPYSNIINTGGVSPLETHDSSIYRRGSFQIVTRAKSYVVARNRATEIWNLLDGQREVTVVAA